MLRTDYSQGILCRVHLKPPFYVRVAGRHYYWHILGYLLTVCAVGWRSFLFVFLGGGWILIWVIRCDKIIWVWTIINYPFWLFWLTFIGCLEGISFLHHIFVWIWNFIVLNKLFILDFRLVLVNLRKMRCFFLSFTLITDG